MNTESEIQDLVANWKERNRYMLPLNMDTWKIQFIKAGISSAPPLKLGKYKASGPISVPFYKSISRIVN